MSVQKSNGPIIDPALCRCCRAIKKCRILTAEYNWMGKKEIYADMVMDCYGILLSHVDDNEKDSGVCATCVVRLREAAAFRHQVLQCEELFLQAKLAPPEEDPTINYENKLKKMELENLELKTEPKDYNSDHSMDLDDRDDGPPSGSDDEDNKPLKPESKPAPPLKEDVKSEDSEDYRGSSSDSDEPIKKKAKRKAKTKANGAKKKPAKSKKQKADTNQQLPRLHEEVDIKVEIVEETRSLENPDHEVPVENLPETEVKKKRLWARDYGDNVSEYEQFKSNAEVYDSYINMSKESFEELHSLLETLIEKNETNYRKSISSRERLAICLRHYRTGLSHNALSNRYNHGITTVSQIVKEVSRAIWTVLQPIYMPAPKEYTWQQAEIGFKDTWDFPNCVGSIAGKHIIARHHPDSEYPKLYELKDNRFVTVTLLAVTDPYNKIVALDIGNYSKDGDSNALENSKFYRKYMNKKDFLPPKPLPGDARPCPYVLVGDAAFVVKSHLLRPYPINFKLDVTRKDFNQRLSKACTAETTVQILMDSWAVLHRPLESQVETAVAIVKAICCLHNFILAKHGKMHPLCPDIDYNKKPRGSRKRHIRALIPFRLTKYRSTNEAIEIRDRFLSYFCRLNSVQDTGSNQLDSLDAVESMHTSTESDDDIKSSNQADKFGISGSKQLGSVDAVEIQPNESDDAMRSSNEPDEFEGTASQQPETSDFDDATSSSHPDVVCPVETDQFESMTVKTFYDPS